MKILRWFLLSVALAFLIVPIGSVPAYAEEREVARDYARVQYLDEPQTTPTKGPRTLGHVPYSYVQPVGGGIAYTPAHILIAIIAGILGIILGGIELVQWLQAKVDKGEYTFLQQWTDEDARRFANSLEKHVRSLETECSMHDRRVTVRAFNLETGEVEIISYTIKMEFSFDKKSGNIECKDPITETVHFTEDLDLWIKTNYVYY